MRRLIALIGAGLLLAAASVAPALAVPANPQSPVDVVNDFDRLILDHHAKKAIEKYIGPNFVEHDPEVGDGSRKGLIDYMKRHGWESGGNPQMRDIIDRIIAQGPMVVVHHHILQHPGDRGVVFVDIFRVENGLITEHWDVMQPVPAHTTNPNTMY